MFEILAALSASAAAGLRIALPLLLIGLFHGKNLWSEVPLLSSVSQPLLFGLLISWSVVELCASKKLLGQRFLQSVELLLSPGVGAIMGLAVASTTPIPNWIIAVVGGSLALVFQLVQIGWFYRLRGLPIWAVIMQDTLCIILVFFATDSPISGGLITLVLLFLAVRSAKQWYKWYLGGKRKQRVL
ncbi:MAG: DUF4126 domain-containing protein [Cyanobacteria bacterium P01_A01_bin.84]